MKKIKNMKGITLIALVVTIIVLLILAGISINLILGDNGIITKAQESKQEQEKAGIIENLQLDIAAKEAEKLQNTNGITQSEIEEILSRYGKVNKNENGVIESLKPTDKDYEISFDKIYKGPIIQQTPIVEYGYDKPYAVEGYTHFGEEDWNSGYRISDTGDETGNIFVWVPCVTDQAKVKEGDTIVTFGKTTEGKYNAFSLGLSPTDTSVTDEEPTNAIKESVEKYGGFYIAAYEAGIEGMEENYDYETDTGRTITNGTVKPLSKSGKGVWNAITREDAIAVAESMMNSKDGVKSGLISGECWDTTLQWMVNASTNKNINEGYDIDSTGRGLYGELTTTGYYPINNIYDMAGNVFEWTTENCKDGEEIYLICRGAQMTLSGTKPPAANRLVIYEDYIDSNAGFRVVLYK